MRSHIAPEASEKRLAENLYLHYLNKYLFEHGAISEKQYTKMIEKINIHKPAMIRENSKTGE